MSIRIIPSIILSAIALMLLQTGVIAQQQNDQAVSVSLRPALIELVAIPGESTQHEITYETDSEQPLAAVIEAKTLIPIDNEIDQSRRSEFDASSWIEFEKTDFIFEPGKPEVIKFTVNVPEEANPGGHYANIGLRPVTNREQTIQATAQIIPEIGAAVFMTVPGDIVEAAEINTDDLVSKLVTKNSPTELSFTISNTGNVHLLPSPKITITKDDQLVEIIQLQPLLVLPNTYKTYTTEWIPDVDYGQYKIRAELVYGNQSTPLSSGQTAFLVTPSLLLLFLLVIALPIAVLLIVRRRNIPKAIGVLQGRATTIKGRFSESSVAKDDITKHQPELDTEAITKELEEQPSILGLPEEDPVVFLEEFEEELTPPEPIKKPHVMSKTTLQGDHQTTHITQTSASTIVRDTKHSEVPKPNKRTQITVLDHYEDLPSIETKPAKAKSVAKKKSAKASTIRKKQATKKKKPAAKKKLTRKASASKKPSVNNKTAKKTQAKKKAPTKKKSTAKK